MVIRLGDKFKSWFRIVKITVWSAIPVVLIILPIDFFDSGQSICLSRLFFDMECYACGMTRAIMHLMHLDFEGAADFNKISFLVLPLLLMYWLKVLLQFFGIRIFKWF